MQILSGWCLDDCCNLCGFTVPAPVAYSLAMPFARVLCLVSRGSTRWGYTCITSTRITLDLNGGDRFNLVSYTSPLTLHDAFVDA